MKNRLSVLKKRADSFLSAMAAGMISSFAQSFMM